MQRSILLFIALLSVALAQPAYDGYGGGGGDSYGDGYRYEDRQGDNLYHNHAARQNDKALGKSRGGWVKLLAASIGGYIVGATRQSLKFKKSTAPKLRFKVGQRVECKIGPTEWATGTVAKLWYDEKSSGHWMPYQIKLDEHDGQMIFAPQDSDLIIRKAKK